MLRYSLDFDSIVNAAIIVAALATVAGWTWYWWSAPAPTVLPPQYEIGDTLSDVQELKPFKGDRTLLLFLNSSCRFCTESMPFYRRMMTTHRGERAERVTVVVVGRQPIDTMREYLNQHDVFVETIIAIEEGSNFRQHVTPSLILVDPSQRIRQLWRGKLDLPAQEVVISEIFSTQVSTAGSLDAELENTTAECCSSLGH